MDLKQLEALHHVVATGSFSAAATELHITQSALSHRIRSLEDELDSAVFVREHRRVRLTPLGENLVGRVAHLFQELQSIRSEFSPSRMRVPGGSLRVSATSVGIAYLYGDIFERYIARYPQVDLQLVGADTPGDAVRRLRERSADVAFAYMPIDDAGMETHVLGSTELVLIASPNHELARRASTTVAEVRRFAFVRHLPGTGARRASDAVFMGDAVGYQRICTESSDVEYVKRIVALGLGLSIVHLFTVQKELASGALKTIRLRGHRPEQQLALVLRRGPRSPAVEHFAALCTEFARQHPMRFRLLPQRANR